MANKIPDIPLPGGAFNLMWGNGNLRLVFPTQARAIAHHEELRRALEEQGKLKAFRRDPWDLELSTGETIQYAFTRKLSPVKSDMFDGRDPVKRQPVKQHPSVEALLKFFEYSHLPAHLALISKPFCVLARSMADNENLQGPELTVALRKLLESKDCAVRAAL